MIPVKQAAEPQDFDRKVRQRGLSAVDELVGRPPRVPHSGRPRKKVAVRESDIPAGNFPPFWRDCSDDMLKLYNRLCAYSALHIEHGTGNPTVDHVIPKSREWDKIYEWSNYRLCAGLINAKKRDLTSLADPFTISSGWFALELVGFQVVRGPQAPPQQCARIDAALPILNLPDFCKARETYAVEYENTHIDLDYLIRRAPFVALELRRQGRLHPKDR